MHRFISHSGKKKSKALSEFYSCQCSLSASIKIFSLSPVSFITTLMSTKRRDQCLFSWPFPENHLPCKLPWPQDYYSHNAYSNASLRDKVNTYHMPENVLGNILEYLETCVTGDIALVLLQSQLAFLVQWFSACGSLPLQDSDDLFTREGWQPLL